MKNITEKASPEKVDSLLEAEAQKFLQEARHYEELAISEKKARADNAKLQDLERKDVEARLRITTAHAHTAEAEATLNKLIIAEKQREEDSVLGLDIYNHTLHLNGAITEDKVSILTGTMATWHRQDPEADFTIFINSPGGSISPGFALVDYLFYMQTLGHKVITVGLGAVMSMGAVVLQAADERVMGENATMLLHQASFETGGSSSQVKDMMDRVKLHEGQILDLLAKKSTFTKDEIAEKWDRKDWSFGAKEALEYGFIDRIQ